MKAKTDMAWHGQSVAKASVSLPSFSASHLISVSEMEATLESQRVPKAPVHLGTNPGAWHSWEALKSYEKLTCKIKDWVRMLIANRHVLVDCSWVPTSWWILNWAAPNFSEMLGDKIHESRFVCLVLQLFKLCQYHLWIILQWHVHELLWILLGRRDERGHVRDLMSNTVRAAITL